MRLKKSDLVKEFEDLVKQEIVNHNKAILDSNISINAIREKVDLSSKENKKSIADCYSFLTNINENLLKFRKELERFSQKVSSKFTDQEHVNERNARNIQELQNALEALGSKYQSHEQSLRNCSSEFSNIQNSLKNIKQSQENDYEAHCRNLSKGLDKLRNDIFDRPSEALQVKKEIEKRLAEKDVDVQGFLRELQIIKKSDFIQEKKLEALFSIVEKLEKGKK